MSAINFNKWATQDIADFYTRCVDFYAFMLAKGIDPVTNMMTELRYEIEDSFMQLNWWRNQSYRDAEPIPSEDERSLKEIVGHDVYQGFIRDFYDGIDVFAKYTQLAGFYKGDSEEYSYGWQDEIHDDINEYLKKNPEWYAKNHLVYS